MTNGSAQLQRHLLRRGLRVWLIVRAIFAIALLMTLNPPLPTGGIVGLGVVAMATVLGVLDARISKEMVFLANLGLRFPVLLLLLALVPLLGEVLLAMLLA